MKRLLMLIAAIVLIVPWPVLVAAQECFARSKVIENLRGYGDEPVAIGLTHDGSLLEVRVGPTGAWALVRTTPQGCSAVIANGAAWEFERHVQGDPA